MTVFLSERSVAARWSVGRSTVARLRLAGRLPHMRIGDVVRYRMADVETFERDHFQDAVVVGLKRRNGVSLTSKENTR